MQPCECDTNVIITAPLMFIYITLFGNEKAMEGYYYTMVYGR
jgi:hypothetical protein